MKSTSSNLTLTSESSSEKESFQSFPLNEKLEIMKFYKKVGRKARQAKSFEGREKT